MARQWQFNPYHQRIDEAMARGDVAPPADTEWPVWEVFQQEKRGDPHIHVGSVHAPDAELALLEAREQYVRRGTAVSLWVAPADAIVATPYDDPDFFVRNTDKSYRENVGFRGHRQGRLRTAAGSPGRATGAGTGSPAPAGALGALTRGASDGD